MYFPQGFITAIKQSFSRKNQLSIDEVVVDSLILPEGTEANIIDNKFNISGVILEGALLNPLTGEILNKPTN
jgi:hypothetical protein